MKQKIFISYSWKDKAYAENLSSLLREKGFSTWSDVEIKPGDDWSESIKDKLKESDIVILLLSEDYQTSRFSLVELGAVLGLGKKVIPISISGKNDSFGLFEKSQILDGRQLNKDKLIHIIRDSASEEAAA